MADHSFFAYVTELFSEIEGIKGRRMFDGYGFYKDDIFFALVHDGKVYLKVGNSNRADYEKIGSNPFQYPMKNGKMTTLSFWELPADILEDRNELPVWIEKAVAAAYEAKKRR